jgi:hypothetical protein
VEEGQRESRAIDGKMKCRRMPPNCPILKIGVGVIGGRKRGGGGGGGHGQGTDRRAIGGMKEVRVGTHMLVELECRVCLL